MDFLSDYGQYTNYVFMGEAGSGKSEIAVNLALLLAERQSKQLHFFDLDMTKPLFRSRDVQKRMESKGIEVHYEQQFMDSPARTFGVSRLLRDPDSLTVLDVGGDDIGARAIGGYASFLNREDTCVFYVVNSYRPWSMDIEHIDQTLSKILGAAHLHIRKLAFIGNPNLGSDTSEEEFLSGCEETERILGPYVPIGFFCAREDLCASMTEKRKVFPLHLQMEYEWQQ